MTRILIYGYGNPGREDDGLGIAFAEAMQKWSRSQNRKNISFEIDYQLNIEDAHTISKYDLVLFADASQEKLDHFAVSVVKASDKVNFTMHTVSPSYVCHLCSEIFNRDPDTLLLHIRGYQWKMKEGLSEKAKLNLQLALDYIQSMIDQPEDWRKQMHASAEILCKENKSSII